jgi:RNA polymerase sigma factor (sigma-70 family)
MDGELSSLAAEAQRGSKDALEALVRAAQRPVYNVALRMLRHPADAEDATQEILIKLVTHLSQFRAESAFSTWMYRIASNHLLNLRTRDRAAGSTSFDQLAGRIAQGLSVLDDTPEEAYSRSVCCSASHQRSAWR